MSNKLKERFPIIRDRQEILEEIHSKKELLAVFNNWETNNQERFLDFCTGVRGVKLLYDSFF